MENLSSEKESSIQFMEELPLDRLDINKNDPKIKEAYLLFKTFGDVDETALLEQGIEKKAIRNFMKFKIFFNYSLKFQINF